MIPSKSRYSTEFALWILFFCFATSASLLFQKLLLPLVPSLHAGSGLLDADSIRFHHSAIELAERIRQSGWSELSLLPLGGEYVNVTLLGALYALFGDDPSLIVPFNAAIHALNGVLIYRIGKELGTGRSGTIAGLAAAILFVGFPSALNWYGQVHKDGFAIVGILVVAWSWIWLRERPPDTRGLIVVASSTALSIVFTFTSRPYNLALLAVALGLVLAAMLVIDVRHLRVRGSKLAIYLLSLALVAAGPVLVSVRGFPDSERQFEASLPDWSWKTTSSVPRWVDRGLETAARLRVRFVESGRVAGASSMIDTEITPDSVAAVAAHAPRAVQVALFAPFPTQWLEKFSLARLVAVFETGIWYLLAPGVLFLLFLHRSSKVLMLLSFGLVFMWIYGLTIPNVGTLYRLRYPILFLFILLGILGWIEAASGWSGRKPGDRGASRPFDIASAPLRPAENGGMPRLNVLSAGVLVAAFTALTYVGLFLRDMILARWFGLGPDLDAFFLATAVPMFLVAVMSLPIGTMIVPQFLLIRVQGSAGAAQRLVSRIAAVYLLAATAAAAALFFGITPALEAIGWDVTPAKLELARQLLAWMLPILILSGLVVLGNAVLNALGYYLIPAMAQLAVPAMSVLALMLFGAGLGVEAAIAGMLAGQVVNLWLITDALRKLGYSVRPALHEPSAEWNSAVRQYLPLAAAALLVNLTAPVNLGMASTLAEGSTAALGLGNKIVFFVTGLVATGVATVILPHFSSFMARRRLLDARNELSFFLLVGTVITIPFAVVAFVGSEALVKLAFLGGAFGERDVESVARIMSYGIIQLPFFTVNLLLLKFAVATRSAGRVLIASLLALCLNVALNAFLMDKHGATGIALAATMACALSAGCMLLLFQRLGHVSWVDLVTIALTWMPYTTFIICLQYQSYAGVVVSTLALLVLLYGHWSQLARWRPAAPGA
jgi:murein biosynthesis integral membrane protein MurJ